MENRDEKSTREIDMEKLQAMLQLLSLSLYGLVSEIMQKFEQNIIFINGDDALWIGDGKFSMVIRSLNSEGTRYLHTRMDIIHRLYLKVHTRFY